MSEQTVPTHTDLESLRSKLDGGLGVLVDSFVTSWTAHSLSNTDALDVEELADIGRHAGEQAAAAAAWRNRLGDHIDTEQLVQLLGSISRQALDSRKRTGSLFALPGTGTSHYPTWQFAIDANTATVRPVVLRIVTEFREYLDDVSPFTIAAWATSPEPELDNRTPADWIINSGDDDRVVLAARRSAHLEAQ